MATVSREMNSGVASPAVALLGGSGGETPPTTDADFEKNVAKRLDSMTEKQDSIQALSMWMIHHKAQCQKIVNCWLAAMKKAKVKRRLVLFYLANDVTQNCKRKNAKIYLLAFKNALKDAVVLVRDDSVVHKVERIFNIWEERGIFIVSFIDELRGLLSDREKVSAHLNIVNADFKPKDICDSVMKVKMLESAAAVKYKQVMNVKLDPSKVDAVKQLKDRTHSRDFAKKFEDSCRKMEDYTKVIQHEIDARMKLIELLEHSQTYYEVQSGDALVVANAYRNFGTRINNLKKRLDEFRATLSGGDTPPLSPSAEAPSPGNTPPPANTEEVDMDMEVSDNEENVIGSVIVAAPPVAQTSSLNDRIAAMSATVGDGAAPFDPRNAGRLAAASASTPPSGSGYSPAEHLKQQRQQTPQTPDAINYLSNLITEKARSSPGQTDSNVLHNLTQFAEKVKNPPKPPPVSWTDYKRQQEDLERKKQETAVSARILEAPVQQPVSQNDAALSQPESTPSSHPASTMSFGYPPIDSTSTSVGGHTESLMPKSQSSSNMPLQSAQPQPSMPIPAATRPPLLMTRPIAPPQSALMSPPPLLQSPVNGGQLPLLATPGSKLTVDDQRDALDLLDSIHESDVKETAPSVDNSSHVYATQNLIEEEINRQSDNQPMQPLTRPPAPLAGPTPRQQPPRQSIHQVQSIQTVQRGATRHFRPRLDRYGYPLEQPPYDPGYDRRPPPPKRPYDPYNSGYNGGYY